MSSGYVDGLELTVAFKEDEVEIELGVAVPWLTVDPPTVVEIELRSGAVTLVEKSGVPVPGVIVTGKAVIIVTYPLPIGD